MLAQILFGLLILGASVAIAFLIVQALAATLDDS